MAKGNRSLLSDSRRTTLVWLALCAITISSWWLAPGHRGGQAAVASVPITVAVISLGFIKGRLIIQTFMEVRTAPQWLRLSTDAWLVVLWASILAIYLI
ncbi:cytochrome C oxidase subunit IV family protein [Mycolicibacterium hodleri]|uniref:Prokaryotic cytochrome C oxidase subunit IV family protein n=1 Tax=Mycolicibacterium hodleri TaxID=49897 RepID=A0A502E6C5_9MYCO|nr:cytochrome C oxidase subunit IV family protein [Mycolicibacterium hodleri]TPG33248.1 prokaryotic cytochrome C oxidase subunit IV family protein [Mycolicibacterium hodleri]